MDTTVSAPRISVVLSGDGYPLVQVLGFSGQNYRQPYLQALLIYKHFVKRRREKKFDLRYGRGTRVGGRYVLVTRVGMRIGCQSFKFAEVDAFAKQQGWFKERMK
jgi:hypothetical protein